jgi:hypothetical protein
MCFKELSKITFTASPTRTDDGNGYYFENHDFGYFGFTSNSSFTTSKVIPNSLQSLINQYNYTTFKDFYTDGFGNSYNDKGNWQNNNDSWNGSNNAPYFNFSLCSLHQMNFYLYIGF